MKLWFQLGIFAMVGSYIILFKQKFAFCLFFMTIFGGYVVSIDMWKCFLNIFNGPTQILKDNKSWRRTFVIWSCGFSLKWGNHCHSSWNWAILPCILSSMSIWQSTWRKDICTLSISSWALHLHNTFFLFF